MNTNDLKNVATSTLVRTNGTADAGEVIFPAVDTATSEEPHARRREWLAVTALVVVALVIGVYLYQQTQPNPAAPTHANHTAAPTHANHTAPAETVTNGTPQTAFRITPEKQQLIGVQYGVVENESLSKSLRVVGRAAFDETKIVRINPKIEGWVEEVYVDFIGKLVNKGQPLLSVYSPDLVQTQEEYLLALKNRKQLGESPFGEAVNFSQSLVDSARKRLQLWDVTDAQIKELETRGTASRTMTLYAPASGFVMTRNAFPKQRVMPDTELYQLADLSNIWIVADVYEFEAADIKGGQSATVTLPAYPGRTFSGMITYIYPQVDNTTRTLKVRVELSNKQFLLKPDMYADVTLNIAYGNRLVVPQEAVMDSGSEQLVYVALADGYFEPRKVQIGRRLDNKYEVLSGLHAGERIVTSGNFLIDSESKLKSTASGMGTPATDHGAAHKH
ncbi:MAG TPA: efflux RND transporter periplasmic adaptor subunit [Pyrinomonadaceae bacterium]|nr:efflux RND transporter periplasmic adaptor subunit [Pyrinomonadaceae bacterium]